MDRNLRDISDNTQEQVRDNKKKELQLLPDLVRDLEKQLLFRLQNQKNILQ